MRPRLTRVPSATVEALRLLVVIFGAGVGWQVAQALGADEDTNLLGPFNGLWIGVIVGAGLGFSLGGVLVRSLMTFFDRGERALDGLSAEQVVAGGFGALLGAALATLVTWPVFLLMTPLLAVPLFLFVVVAAAVFGFQAGRRRRGAVLEAVGPRAGLSSRGPWIGRLPRILDTSVAIDGRILDVVRAGFQGGQILVPEPVLAELQGLADSSDDLRRAKGRRGLDVLEALRKEDTVDLEVVPDGALAIPEVDAKLVRMCLDRPAALLTFDSNLAKVASLAGVRVLNMHRLALSLRPPVVVGDLLTVHLTKPGKEQGQAVAYLDDGTMVVVEGARDRVGEDLEVVISSVLMTANGRLVFAQPGGQTLGQAGGSDLRRSVRPAHAPAPDEHPTPGDLRPAAPHRGRTGRDGRS
ncbi:MAG: TRAM domain-containing protein [Candidatus Nanopelagicales bacterium]